MTSFPSSVIVAVKNLEAKKALKLRDLAAREDIKDTSSLVTAYNSSNDLEERKLFRYWLNCYVDCFQPKIPNLNEEDIEYIAALGEIEIRSKADQDMVMNLLMKMAQYVIAGSFFTKGSISALEHILSVTKRKILNETTSYLEDLLKVLQEKLSQEQEFSRKNYRIFGSVIFLLHCTIVKLNEVKLATNETTEEVKATMKHIKKKQNYFPVYFYSKQVQISVEEFAKNKTFSNTLVEAARFCFYLAVDLLFITQDVLAIKSANLDIDAFVAGGKRLGHCADTLAKYIKEMLKGNRKWDQELEKIRTTAANANENNSLQPLRELDAEINNQNSGLFSRNKKKIWEYLLIMTLNSLTAKGFDEAKRELLNRGQLNAQRRNGHDPDMFEALLDTLYTIHQMQQDKEIAEILERMCCNENEKLKSKIEGWLDGESINDKLRDREERKGADTLFEKIKGMLGLELTFSDVNRNIENLKTFYAEDEEFIEVRH